MYDLTEQLFQTSGVLKYYCRNELFLADCDDFTDFNEGNANTNSFKIKKKK